MRKLEDTINDDYKFTRFTQGFFTIKRIHKFWLGVWTDMTIERILMRSKLRVDLHRAVVYLIVF